MAGIRIVPFMGMLPKVAERLLGDGAAVDATNVTLTSGEIRPIKRPLLVNTPAVSGPWLSVYRAEHNGAQVWLAWSRDVDIVRAPLPPAVEPRFYWAGDGEPRYAQFSGLPGDLFALGVPKPKAAPGVSVTGGTGLDVTRVYAYTFYSALNEESAESPASALVTGKVDGTWAITGMDAFPVSSGTGTASHTGGVTTFTNTGNHWLRVGDEVVISSQTVVVSEATSNSVFKVPGNFTGATTWARKAAWNTSGMKRRLYRSAGTTGSYQLVADDVGTSYNDTLTDAQILGDELISQSWEPPPTNLKGVIALPNGALAGFFDNQLCYSEPYQPHAWPTEYRRATDYEIVGIQSYGTTVVACTAGTPYIAQGTEPASVTLESVDQVWPCLAKRSVVSIGDGVLYATGHGLAYVGMNGASIWTQPFFSRTEWARLDPSSMVSAMAEGRVFVRWMGENGDKGVMVFSPAEAGLGLTLLSACPDELYGDPRNGKLYLVDEDGIHQYDAAEGARIDFSWKSKEYHLASPINLGAAKVDFVSEMSQADFDAAQAAYESAVLANESLVSGYFGVGGINARQINRGLLNGSNIQDISLPDAAGLTFTLYCDGAAVFSRTLVNDQSAFRLPAGFRTANVAVGLTGAVRVKKVILAETMLGLKQG
jgi:hypothetical protein